MRGSPAGASDRRRARGAELRSRVRGPLLSRRLGRLRRRPRRPLDWLSRVRRPVALPSSSPAHVRGRRGPGARGAHAAQRGRAGQGPPRLPVRGLARDGQDLDGEDPRRVPELRARADRRAVRRVRFLRGHRQRHLARRDRDGRRLEQLRRRHPRAARARRVRAGVGPVEDLHPRRGPHALDPGLERVPQDARGAAAGHHLRARHHRGPEGPRHRGRPLPPLRLRPPYGRADRRGPAARRARPRTSRSRTPRSRSSPATPPARSATRWARSSSS